MSPTVRRQFFTWPSGFPCFADMHEPFIPDQTVRLGKYVLPRDVRAAMRHGCHPPRWRLSVNDVLSTHTDTIRRIAVSSARQLPAGRFEYHGTDPRYHDGHLPAVAIPPTFVVEIARGRVVGRTGTVHAPAADACLVEFEWPTDDLTWLRHHLPGGILHPRYWKQSLLRAIRRRALPAPRPCPGRVAVLNGAAPHNFFHWMTEILPRLLTLRRAGIDADWYVVDAGAAFQQEALMALGVSLDRVIQPHGLLHLEADTLLVPSIRPLQELVATATTLAAALGVSEAKASRRVFVDRRRSRRIANAMEVETTLNHLGFIRVFPEELTLRDQVSLFRTAEIVLGQHGAGLTNIMHCHPGTLVVEIMPAGTVRPCYAHLSQLFGLRHVMLSAPRRGWHQDVHLAVDQLRAIVPPR